MHYLSVLAQFKNETYNLDIWLQHYIWQGVEHFYLIDNGSTDNPLTILQPYIKKGLVTYYYKPQKYMQKENYRIVFDKANLRYVTKWLIICDLDEFFYGVDKKLSTKLKTLEMFNVLYANWLMFGTDGLIHHPKDIRTSIVHREYKLNENTKMIIQPRAFVSSQVSLHCIVNPITNARINAHPRLKITNKLIRLNHYPIQSKEFYDNVKTTRGDATASRLDNVRNAAYFVKGTKFCNYKDNTLKSLIENPPPNY
jgi:hypothetical protein